MNSHELLPERIETNHLMFERFDHSNVNPFQFYEFVSQDDWQTEATEHMPWYRFQRIDQVFDFIDKSARRWFD